MSGPPRARFGLGVSADSAAARGVLSDGVPVVLLVGIVMLAATESRTAAVLGLAGTLPFAFAGHGRWARALVACAILTVVAALATWRAESARSELARGVDSVREAFSPPDRCDARATIVGQPRSVGDALMADVRLTSLRCDRSEREGPIRAAISQLPADSARGDMLELVVDLGVVGGLANPGIGDWRDKAARRGTALVGRAIDSHRVTHGRGMAARIDRARAHVRTRIVNSYPDRAAAMARALVLGEHALDPGDARAFGQSGLSHLLAVSGLHLMLVVVGLRRAIGATLCRLPWIAGRVVVRRATAPLGIAMAWAYADFAGSTGSAIRAAWMLSFAYAGAFFGVRTDARKTLGASLVASQCVDPLIGSDLSFVLSAVATTGIVSLTVVPAGSFRSLSGWSATAARTVGATVAATLACAPLLAKLGERLPAGTLFANLAAAPLGELAALPLCLVHACASWSASLESGAALAASGALDLLSRIAHTFSSGSWTSVRVPSPTATQAALWFFSLGAVALAPMRRTKLAIAFALMAALVLERRWPANTRDPTFEVMAIDVGQGDALLITAPGGEHVLVDTGGFVGSPVDVGERVIAPLLRAKAVSELELVVITHPHPDHYGGLDATLRSVRVRELWDTGEALASEHRGGFAERLHAATASGTRVRTPPEVCARHRLGELEIEVLAPCPSVVPERSTNDNSFVIRASARGCSVLLTGDAEGETERELVERESERLSAGLLKVGHHGSRTSSSPEFLAAVGASDAIISSGARNRFGHPHPETLGALGERNTRIWRTDRLGAITARCESAKWAVTAERGRL